jgi:Uma2 family endonuclease
VAVTIEPSEFERFIDTDTLLNPAVIFEIYSAENERYLRGDKFHYYRSLRSFREYVLVSRDTYLVERFMRKPDNTWLLTVFDNLSQTLPLATLACELPLTEIYYRVEFPSAEVATPA